MDDRSKIDRSHIARIALSQAGVREVGGNNCGPEVRMYQEATWLLPGPWPWCAAFVCWCVREWILKYPHAPAHPLMAGLDQTEWRPRTAGAYDLINWASKRGLKILDRGAAVEAGDLVVFDMSHCGIVTEDRARTTPTILTVEGNTGPAGGRDAASGDGVFNKRRDRKLVRNFIRLEPATPLSPLTMKA